jgi:asparagine synthase (glutamine-hydrolysing)
MCGIAGGMLLNQQPFEKNVLENMIAVIKHRGPDDNGIYINQNIGLGFRRLSIIDLSPSGHQPMSVCDETIWIVFNGEIYNFELLRKELEVSGIRFKSASDTEVILQLYKLYGINCFERLRGMFAIAIWDDREKQLILARDRVGKKPLYYYYGNQNFLFASELKSIFQYPDLEYNIDTNALSEYFSYGFIGSPRTIYESISKLEPGCYLKIDAAGRKTIASYWNWTPSKPENFSFEEAKQLVFDKVDESIKLRMRSDVPLGAFLSGGIDSTIVVARMAEYSASPVKTFTIGFKEKAFDESEYASLVAKRYGTKHHLEVVDPDYTHLIENIVSNFDEPFGDSSALPTYVVSKMISKHVTVALSGDGGDEVFGGYEIYQESLLQKKIDKVPSSIKQLAKLFDPIYPESLPGRNYLRRFTLPDSYERFIERYKLISDPERQKLLSGIAFKSTSHFKREYFEQLKEGTEFLSSLRFNDLKHYLEGDILMKVDRATMLNSIESRAPLLDHELIELSFKLPSRFLINNGQKKFILKEAFKSYIPSELFNRPKKGFSIPLASWFRNELHHYFEDIVFNSKLQQSGLIDLSYVKRLFSIHLSKKRDLSFHLWLILSFAIWYNSVHLKVAKPKVLPLSAN